MIARGRGIFKRDMGGYLGKGGRLKKGVGGGKGTGRVVKLEHENFGEIVAGIYLANPYCFATVVVRDRPEVQNLNNCGCPTGL